jgi:hypothetical protein
MIAGPTCKIDVEDREIVVRLRSDLFSQDEVSRFLDYLELESIRRRSDLSDEQAAALAAEIDQSVWERARHRIEDP